MKITEEAIQNPTASISLAVKTHAEIEKIV